MSRANGCVCIRDGFGDVHARAIYGEANKETCLKVASDLAADIGCDEDYMVGLSAARDPGAARLRNGVDYADGGIAWMWSIVRGDEVAS